MVVIRTTYTFGRSFLRGIAAFLLVVMGFFLVSFQWVKGTLHVSSGDAGLGLLGPDIAHADYSGIGGSSTDHDVCGTEQAGDSSSNSK